MYSIKIPCITLANLPSCLIITILVFSENIQNLLSQQPSSTVNPEQHGLELRKST